MTMSPPTGNQEQMMLLELLEGIDDPSERERILRAWKALAPLARVVQMPPRPSDRLAALLTGSDVTGDELSSHDLGMVVGGTGPAPAAPAEGADPMAPWLDGSCPDPRPEPRPDAGPDLRPELRRPRQDDEPAPGQDTTQGAAQAPAELLGGDGEADPADPDLLALLGKDDGDVFLFGDDDGDAAIQDFDPDRDRLRFTGLRGPEDLDISECETGTLVSFRRTRVLLQGLRLGADRVLELIDDD